MPALQSEVGEESERAHDPPIRPLSLQLRRLRHAQLRRPQAGVRRRVGRGPKVHHAEDCEILNFGNNVNTNAQIPERLKKYYFKINRRRTAWSPLGTRRTAQGIASRRQSGT